jgi:putative inorganic carbon (HCO3(-)) transporter
VARVGVAAVAAVFGLVLIRISGLPLEWTFFVVALVIFPAVAAVTGQLRKLLLAVILLELPLPLDVYLRYNEEYASLGAIGGINISVTTLALAVLYALWLGDVFVIRRDGDRTGRLVRTTVPLLAYVSLVAVSILAAKDRALAVNELVMLVQILLLYFYLLHAIRSWHDVRFVLSMLLLGLIVESAIMLVLPLVGESFAVGFLNANLDEETGRVGGTIGSYNMAGAYLSVMMAVAMAVLVSPHRGLLRFAASAGLILGGVAIILTGSRGGWLALIVAAAILSFCAWRRGWLSPKVPVAMGLGAVSLVVVFQRILAARVVSQESHSAVWDRVPLMRLAGRMIADNPVLGVGANNFAFRAEDYWPTRTVYDWLYVVHNKYLLIASENGLLTLAVFVLFLYLTVRCGLRVWQGRDRLLAPIALGLTAGVIGHMMHFLFDIFNDRGQVELLWIVAALIAVVYRLEIQRRQERDKRDAESVTTGDPSVIVSGDGAVTSGNRPVSWSGGHR